MYFPLFNKRKKDIKKYIAIYLSKEEFFSVNICINTTILSPFDWLRICHNRSFKKNITIRNYSS